MTLSFSPTPHFSETSLMLFTPKFELNMCYWVRLVYAEYPVGTFRTGQGGCKTAWSFDESEYFQEAYVCLLRFLVKNYNGEKIQF